MNWKVKYRGESGNVKVEVVSADSRSGVFAEMRKRGVNSVLGVEECRSDNSSAFRHVRDVWRKAFIGIFLIVLVAGVVSYYYFRDQKNSGEETAVRPPTKTKSGVSAKPSRKGLELEKTKPADRPFWDVDASQTNGFTRVQQLKWEYEHRTLPAYTNTTALTEAPPAYAIFKTQCENEIACYLTLEPGDTLVGTPHYTEKQKKALIAELDTPMIYDKDDTQEQRQLRALVEETKADLKKRISAGEDIGEIFLKTREELQDLSNYKNEISGLLSELRAKPETTIEDVEDFVNAANIMLEGKGIAPLKLGVITRRMLQSRQKGETEK